MALCFRQNSGDPQEEVLGGSRGDLKKNKIVYWMWLSHNKHSHTLQIAGPIELKQSQCSSALLTSMEVELCHTVLPLNHYFPTEAHCCHPGGKKTALGITLYQETITCLHDNFHVIT